jgi:zona occludens toxin (predicted ATPase)
MPALVVPAATVAASDTFKLDTVVRTLLEDFDKGVQTNLLYPFLGAGSWYMIAEDSVTVTPASAVADVATAISPVNAWQGRSFYLGAATTASVEARHNHHTRPEHRQGTRMGGRFATMVRLV